MTLDIYYGGHKGEDPVVDRNGDPIYRVYYTDNEGKNVVTKNHPEATLVSDHWTYNQVGFTLGVALMDIGVPQVNHMTIDTIAERVLAMACVRGEPLLPNKEDGENFSLPASVKVEMFRGMIGASSNVSKKTDAQFKTHLAKVAFDRAKGVISHVNREYEDNASV